MNYYEHHIGDYLKDTLGLSMLEEGAYRRLIDVYYAAEKPLPADIGECFKLARAHAKAEKDAVRKVLERFFVLDGDGFRQGRSDKEIARYQAKSSKAAASANARWNKCERNANASETHMQKQCESDAPNPQSPVTSNQEGKEKKRASAPDRGTRIPEDFGLTPERRGVAEAEGIDPERTLQGFRDYWTARPGAGGRKADWDATWRVWCRRQLDAKTVAPRKSASLSDRLTWTPTE